jgi:predicted acetyltransferase
MPEPTIRPVDSAEMLQAVYPLTSYALHPTLPLLDPKEWQERVATRRGVTCFAVYEDETSVACAASASMSQNVRGAVLGMGGIWGVATHPAARRKGYSRRLLQRLLEEMHRSGRPLSALYPFRESFYERLGYVTLPQIHKSTFAASTLAPLLKADLGGEVEIALIGERHDVYREYMRQMQHHTHGMAMFDYVDQASVQSNRSWLALAKASGKTVGLMLYRLSGEGPIRFTMSASRFYYRCSQGKFLLLQWIARHVDQVDQVELWLPASELPETWLSDVNAGLDRATFTPMGRVVDLAQLGGVQTGPGHLSVRVRDPTCPWNEGTWQLETANGRLQVSPSAHADCELSIQALSALVYGAHDPGDFWVRGWGNPSPENLATMREMFPPQIAYLHEWF